MERIINEYNIFDFNKRKNMVSRNVRQICRYFPYSKRLTILNSYIKNSVFIFSFVSKNNLSKIYSIIIFKNSSRISLIYSENTLFRISSIIIIRTFSLESPWSSPRILIETYPLLSLRIPYLESPWLSLGTTSL